MATPARPRLVSFITGLGVGGAETALLRLLEASEADFQHLVIALTGGGPLATEFRAAGIPVKELGLAGWNVGPRRLLRVRRWLDEFQPDIITAHMYHAAVASAPIRRLAAPRAPLIWVVHHSLGDIRSEGRSTRLALWICRLLSGAPQQIIYVSERSAEQHAAYGFPVEKSLVIPNGYDMHRFRPDPEARLQLRSQWGFSDDDVVIGHVARVHRNKDHATFIAALVRATDQDARIAAVLCGPGTESLEIPERLRNRVRLLGMRADIPKVMSACDVGCLSSSSEAFPNVLAEFLACGLPCVTTDVGDAALIVGEFGRIVPPQEPAALAEALVAIARMGQDERTVIGLAARESVAERFDIHAVAARHAERWRALLHERGS